MYWLALRCVLHAAILATVLFCFRAGTGWPAVLIGGLILYNGAVIALVGDVYIRYADHVMPLSIMLAGLSVSSCVRVVASSAPERKPAASLPPEAFSRANMLS